MQTDLNTVDKFESLLKEHDMRMTSVRRGVFASFVSHNGPLTVQQLVEMTSAGHFVSVYRTVELFLKLGVIKQVPRGFKNHYELSDLFLPHHHHVTCESCGTTREVNDPRIEDLMKNLTLKAGLEPTKHHFEMYGLCRSCQ